MRYGQSGMRYFEKAEAVDLTEVFTSAFGVDELIDTFIFILHQAAESCTNSTRGH